MLKEVRDLRKYNFDRKINRNNTNSIKYDFPEDYGYTKEHIPLWVADMDFPVAEEIKSVISSINSMGIYGYTGMSNYYYEVLAKWMRKEHNYKIEREWCFVLPGVMFAISTAIRAFSEEGDAIMVQTPVYSPFYKVIENNNRVIVGNSLVYENGEYFVDYVDFENKIKENNVKIFLLSNPHNPVGKVFTKNELIRMAHICCKYKVLVVSDEIHQDFIYEPHTHTVLANLNEKFENNCVICTSPSKTFNIAGLKVSNTFIANPKLRKLYDDTLKACYNGGVNTLGMAACVAAYSSSGTWLKQVKTYIKKNLDYVTSFIEKNTPKIKVVKPQGTYLMWLDCHDMGLSPQEIDDFFKDDAKLWFNIGQRFGKDGEYFQRINLATGKYRLEEAMERMKKAYDHLYKEELEEKDVENEVDEIDEVKEDDELLEAKEMEEIEKEFIECLYASEEEDEE